MSFCTMVSACDDYTTNMVRNYFQKCINDETWTINIYGPPHEPKEPTQEQYKRNMKIRQIMIRINTMPAIQWIVG